MAYNTKIPLFRRWVLQNFPFIEQDFDALTDYQLICKVVEYLNKVIENVNACGEQIEILTNAFNQLKDYVDNYFDNLDVQEEINNKLDEMVSDGTFTDLLRTYLDFATPEMYGAYGDGIHNDSKAIQDAFDSGKLVVFSQKTYLCFALTCNYPDRKLVIEGNGATLKRPNLSVEPYNMTPDQMKWIQTIFVSTDCEIKNLNFDNNCFTMWQVSDGYAQEQACSVIVRNLESMVNFNIDNCSFKNSAGDGLHLAQNVNAEITNCRSTDCFRGGLTLTGYGCEINVNGWLSETITDGVQDGFDVEVDSQSTIYPTKFILNMSNVVLDYDLDIHAPEYAIINLNNIVMREYNEESKTGYDLIASKNSELTISNSYLRSGKTPSIQTQIQGGIISYNNCVIKGNSTDPALRVTQYQPQNLDTAGQLNLNSCTITGVNFMSVATIKGSVNVNNCNIKTTANLLVNNGTASPAIEDLYFKNNIIEFAGMFGSITTTTALNATARTHFSGNSIKGSGDNAIKTWGNPEFYYDSTPMEGAIVLQTGAGSSPKFYGNNRVIIVATGSDLTFKGWVAGNDIAIAKDTGDRYQYTSGTTWTQL